MELMSIINFGTAAHWHYTQRAGLYAAWVFVAVSDPAWMQIMKRNL
jgi:hypothetical protein